MDPNLTKDLLLEVSRSVLEDSAFVFADESDSPPALPGGVLLGRIRFSGPEDGEIQLRMSSTLAANVAANMLGIEADDAEAAQRSSDAVGETLNVIAGAVLARVYGTRVVCHLGVPKVVSGGPAAPDRGCVSASLVTDEGLGFIVTVIPREPTP